MTVKINLPHAGLVLLAGPSNSGKTTLLNKFIADGVLKKSEVLSSDDFRIIVGDTDYIDWSHRPKDESSNLYEQYQQITTEAFKAMDAVLEARLRLNKLTIIDATHLYPEERKRYIDLAKKHHLSVSFIALDVPEKILLERDQFRELPRGKKRIQQQVKVFKKNLRTLKKEGFRAQYIIKPEETDSVQFIRRENPLILEVEYGFDIIGDIHGCFDEFIELLEKLGYEQNSQGLYIHPEGRKFISLGDITSRGPKSLDTLLFFKKHIDNGLAYMVDSNHGYKIARYLEGRKVILAHGDELVQTELEKYETEHGTEATDKLKQEIKQMLQSVPSHYVLTKNNVPTAVVVHAGIRDEMIGKQSPQVSDFCRYGDTAGVDDSGKPIRKDWTISHESSQLIIWGHDPRPHPQMINNTINIDQGVVFGGKLTAFRYPQQQIIQVKAKKDYANTADNPLLEWERKRLDPPNIQHFINGYTVLTEKLGEIAIQKENVLPALDQLSRVMVPLEELVYIPPTMSPAPKPSLRKDYMEHPEDAFEYYFSNGIKTLICEKKHMGSRAILLIFKNKTVSTQYVGKETLGTIYTRRGRPFFNKDLETEILEKLQADLNRHEYFEKNDTDFVLLDTEILPWNLKAEELIQNQYAHVGEMARLDREELEKQLLKARENGYDVADWLAENESALTNTKVFQNVFEKYMWKTEGMEGIQIAPFHTLAHSNETFFDKTHLWHMQQNEKFSEMSSLFLKTEYRVINDETSMMEAIRWWEAMTEDGHEGFVVKPESFIARNDRGRLLQPAIKVRGRKYLHIIYGMDYLQPENLERLKNRNTTKKQRNAIKEFALGIEAIERFVKKDSLTRIHECVLGILALEMDPIDPRL